MTSNDESEVILYLLDWLSQGEKMKINFYRNGETKLMGYSAEVRGCVGPVTEVATVICQTEKKKRKSQRPREGKT